MSCTFRFVGEPDPSVVTLRLFRDPANLPRGEVIGPMRIQQALADRCLVDCETAFRAAIRIANCQDAEVVVLGDPTLWNPGWGQLIGA